MKRFWLFQGENHDPQGGASDLIGSFDTAEEAVAAWTPLGAISGEWAQVFDAELGRIIQERLTAYGGEWREPK